MKLAAILLILCFASTALAADPYVLVLGTAQDAGVPQMGCDSPFCKKAWATGTHEPVSSIALVDPDNGKRWIFDATPDMPRQFEMLRSATKDRSPRLDGIFLTHAHIGHYTGLMYLGRESMGVRYVPVYAMPRMREMLEKNAPWSQLVQLENIAIRSLIGGQRVDLGNGISVEPFLVPHRDEFSETVGFRIRSAKRTLIFIPDIDKWSKWSTPLAKMVSASDFLLLDGTFYADGEISRPMSEVPHPFVTETMELLKGLSATDRKKVYFIHFNHSNPLIQRDQKKLDEVRKKGFRVATTGLKILL
jgi:pyrroloquinoline quinone biosynthesis protein B